MIRHMVLFRWIPEATPEQKQRVVTELGRLPALPTLRAYHVGPDLGLVEGNFDFAVAVDFDDFDGYLTHAEIAQRKLDEIPAGGADHDFYTGKLGAARFFAATVLPRLAAERKSAEETTLDLMELPEGAF